MRIAIIGPSHAKQLANAVQQGSLPAPPRTRIRGFQSAPIFAEPILREVERCSHYDTIFLYVAGSLRCNYLHSKMHGRFLLSTEDYWKSLSKNPFLFDRKLLGTARVVQRMDRHLQSWLDFYSGRFPQVRFMFWCEFASTWKNRRRNDPKDGISRCLYDDWVKANPNHVDLEHFALSTKLDLSELMQKDGAHKNARGRKLFLEYLVTYARSMSTRREGDS